MMPRPRTSVKRPGWVSAICCRPARARSDFVATDFVSSSSVQNVSRAVMLVHQQQVDPLRVDAAVGV
jgi:hypothetical protein